MDSLARHLKGQWLHAESTPLRSPIHDAEGGGPTLHHGFTDC